ATCCASTCIPLTSTIRATSAPWRECCSAPTAACAMPSPTTTSRSEQPPWLLAAGGARSALRVAHGRRVGGAGRLGVGARRRPRFGVTAGDVVDVARDDAALDAALAGEGQGRRVEGG